MVPRRGRATATNQVIDSSGHLLYVHEMFTTFTSLHHHVRVLNFLTLNRVKSNFNWNVSKFTELHSKTLVAIWHFLRAKIQG